MLLSGLRKLALFKRRKAMSTERPLISHTRTAGMAVRGLSVCISVGLASTSKLYECKSPRLFF